MVLPIDTATVRTGAASDAQAVADIYNYHVLNTVVTFEEAPVAASDIAQRLRDVEAALLPWFVAGRDGSVVGYAYAAPWHPRRAYRLSAEVTVYVGSGHTGQGLGSRLYDELLTALRSRRLHTAIGGIALPNEASVALHEKLGFRKVAHFEAVGFKFNRWIDVGYWQRILWSRGRAAPGVYPVTSL